MEFSRVELVQPHYGAVNVYRIGDTLVDTGHVCPESRELLRDELDGGALDGVERVVLTHHHIDHVGGALTVPAVTALPLVVFEGAADLVRDFEAYLERARDEMATIAADPAVADPQPDDRYFPLDLDYASDDVRFERVVADGDTVSVGPYDCEVVHTPGHCHQHMALHHAATGTMVSGDIVSTNGHFMYGPLHWDLGEYKTGLARVRDREPDLLLPGHGEPMDDPSARVEDALAKVDAVETAILAAVDEHGTLHARDLAREALGASDQTVGFLGNVAAAYAVHLADRGLLDVDRRPYVVASPA